MIDFRIVLTFTVLDSSQLCGEHGRNKVLYVPCFTATQQ